MNEPRKPHVAKPMALVAGPLLGVGDGDEDHDDKEADGEEEVKEGADRLDELRWHHADEGQRVEEQREERRDDRDKTKNHSGRTNRLQLVAVEERYRVAKTVLSDQAWQSSKGALSAIRRKRLVQRDATVLPPLPPKLVVPCTNTVRTAKQEVQVSRDD
eukprot:4384461-Pleurochrysis_carterae.AAC.1